MAFGTNNLDQGMLLLLQKKLKALQEEVDELAGGGGLGFDDIYPVGSIYMSVNGTDPGTLFGGTWARIKDTFLLSAGDTYSAGDTGGEAAHKLAESELPKLSGSMDLRPWGSVGGALQLNASGIISRSTSTASDSGVATAASNRMFKTTISFGGDQPHNNMPPYLAVYVWQRTA